MNIKIKDIVDVNHTISKDLFEDNDKFYEIISKIKDYVIKLGNRLDKTKYIEVKKEIWIANNDKVDNIAKI